MLLPHMVDETMNIIGIKRPEFNCREGSDISGLAYSPKIRPVNLMKNKDFFELILG
jgi:hypothetical protein